jgi:hypothetical protein
MSLSEPLRSSSKGGERETARVRYIGGQCNDVAAGGASAAIGPNSADRRAHVLVNSPNETKYYYQDLDMAGARLNGASDPLGKLLCSDWRTAFRFLRQLRRPSAPRPVAKSGRAGGTGT